MNTDVWVLSTEQASIVIPSLLKFMAFLDQVFQYLLPYFLLMTEKQRSFTDHLSFTDEKTSTQMG
jgi:hypothetical protein